MDFLRRNRVVRAFSWLVNQYGVEVLILFAGVVFMLGVLIATAVFLVCGAVSG